MLSFNVRFIKTVCDDSGDEHRACEAAFKVHAASLGAAAQQAEIDFCKQKSVRDWRIFADVLELRAPPAGVKSAHVILSSGRKA
ncbi:hypothetical protein XH99_07010 [Bradyrhizobium nanningense]|uniref:Uncharacterized protein n=1 Tax=Bradyrhizobium nanningense TaxID=1325118 RepID=A0A4Q0SFN3_9BRAD|nr:hypothetical protein [Bradyrhizobium nanningense]RXH36690.1 hypothetical protein XH99_07010 [Bradyrhizobium nanningense]